MWKPWTPHTTPQPKTQGSTPSHAPSESICLRLHDILAAFADAFAATEQGKANVDALDAPHDTAAKDAGLDPLAQTK